MRLLGLFVGYLADDRGLDRPASRVNLLYCLGLEPDNRLGQHRVEHTTSAFPRG